MNMLLVEDNAAIQEYIRQAVAELPSKTALTIIDNEAQAVAWLDANPDAWDVAVIDIFLRKGHGFNVLRQCQRRAKHQRAVMFSNYSSMPMAERAAQAGADAFFDKEAELGDLVGYLKKVASEV